MPEQHTNLPPDDIDDIVGRLQSLDRALLGSTTGDDEAISAVCESAVEVIEQLRAALRRAEEALGNTPDEARRAAIRQGVG